MQVFFLFIFFLPKSHFRRVLHSLSPLSHGFLSFASCPSEIRELKNEKLPAFNWLPLLWAHCWSIAHTELCQDQFRCLSGQATAEVSPPVHLNQSEFSQWAAWIWTRVKSCANARTCMATQKSAVIGGRRRRGRDKSTVGCSTPVIIHEIYDWRRASMRSRSRYILLWQPVIILFTSSICLCT